MTCSCPGEDIVGRSVIDGEATEVTVPVVAGDTFITGVVAAGTFTATAKTEKPGVIAVK